MKAVESPKYRRIRSIVVDVTGIQCHTDKKSRGHLHRDARVWNIVFEYDVIYRILFQCVPDRGDTKRGWICWRSSDLFAELFDVVQIYMRVAETDT